jgi:hypothetical protein
MAGFGRSPRTSRHRSGDRARLHRDERMKIVDVHRVESGLQHEWKQSGRRRWRDVGPAPWQAMSDEGAFQHRVCTDDDHPLKAVACSQGGGNLVRELQRAVAPEKAKPPVTSRLERRGACVRQVAECRRRVEPPLFYRHSSALQESERRPSTPAADCRALCS